MLSMNPAKTHRQKAIDGFADHFRGGTTKHILGCFVEHDDLLPLVDCNDGIHRRCDNAEQAFLAVAKGVFGALVSRDVDHRALDERQAALLIAGCSYVFDHPDRASILPSKAQLRTHQTPLPLQIPEELVVLLGREVELLCLEAEDLFPGGISQHLCKCTVAAKHSAVWRSAVETGHVPVKQELVAAVGSGCCWAKGYTPQIQLTRYGIGECL